MAVETQGKSDAPELMSSGAIEPLAGLSHFEKFTQTLPALLNKGKNIFSFFPLPYISKVFFGLISGREIAKIPVKPLAVKKQ